MTWIDSYKEGFFTINRNKMLILITVISVFFGRLITLVEQISKLTVKDIVMQSINLEQIQEIIRSVQSGELDKIQVLLEESPIFNYQDLKAVSLLFLLLIISFLIAFFTDVGLGGLIKDLLLKSQYRKTQLVSYGKFYFNTCFLFKISAYVITGCVILILMPLYLGLYEITPDLLTFSIAGGLISLPLALIYTGFLSLGVKFIIVENKRKLSEIYNLTNTLMLNHKKEVAIYFFWEFTMATSSAVIAYFLMDSNIQFFLRYSLVIFLLSYVAAFLKLCGFVFYLKIKTNS